MIAVALSGGADSLAALLLLREEGGDVLAVHGRFLPEPDTARERALAETCARLGVGLEILDLRAKFEELVASPFVQAYALGLTPNPCAACNRAVKFGALLEAVLALGAEGLATGHYAILEQTDRGPRLKRGVDPVKEQSYFLSLVPLERWERVRLPLGLWTKERVRSFLESRGIVPPESRESQEVCFVPDDDYRAFLQARGAELTGTGPIRLARDGREIGRHEGLWRYTLGQRRGLRLPWTEPLYVAGKDLESNTLWVGPAESLESRGCEARGANVLVPPGEWPEALTAQVRYRQKSRPARVELKENRIRVEFESPGPPPAPGQSVAVYGNEEVLAAGVIEQVW